mgnify:CR=1 FL=1
MHHHPPEFGITALLEGKRWRDSIESHKPEAWRPSLKTAEQKGAGVGADHITTGSGIDTAVDDEKITVKDAGSGHGIPTGTHEEGAGWRGDKQIMQIDLGLDVVIRWAGKTSGHRLQHQRQGPAGMMTPQGHGHRRVDHARSTATALPWYK